MRIKFNEELAIKSGFIFSSQETSEDTQDSHAARRLRLNLADSPTARERAGRGLWALLSHPS